MAKRDIGAETIAGLREFRDKPESLVKHKFSPANVKSARERYGMTQRQFAAFLMIRRLVVGPEVEGVFTLFAILFAFIGVLMLAVGVVGEYVARIYAEVRRRPIYRIRQVISSGRADDDA